jgi:hypothetical protein
MICRAALLPVALAAVLPLALPGCGSDSSTPTTAVRIDTVGANVSRCNQQMSFAQVGVGFTATNTGSGSVELSGVRLRGDNDSATGSPLVDATTDFDAAPTLAPGEAVHFDCVPASAQLVWPSNPDGHELAVTVSFGSPGSGGTGRSATGHGALVFFETFDNCDTAMATPHACEATLP